jgi:hypothetical protein
MFMNLDVHNTEPKLWAALSFAYEIKGYENTKWITVPMDDGKTMTFFGPRGNR